MRFYEEKKYQGTARVKRAQLQALRRDFETLQMKEGQSVMSYWLNNGDQQQNVIP